MAPIMRPDMDFLPIGCRERLEGEDKGGTITLEVPVSKICSTSFVVSGGRGVCDVSIVAPCVCVCEGNCSGDADICTGAGSGGVDVSIVEVDVVGRTTLSGFFKVSSAVSGI